MKPASKPPNIWVLASVTYGAVILVTVLSVIAYFYIAPKHSSQSSDEARSVIVGSVWIPIYPGAMIASTESARKESVTESTLTFETKDQAGPVLSFYEAALKKGVFRFSIVKKTANGGTVRSLAREGKTTVLVTIQTSGDGSRGEVRTTDTDKKD